MTYETIFLQIAADYAKFHALSPMHGGIRTDEAAQ
jgi:hypothetical protein